jgi:hypothetical protein
VTWSLHIFISRAMASEAVTELRRKIGISTREDYEKLGRRANDARVKSEQARLVLEQHIGAPMLRSVVLSFVGVYPNSVSCCLSIASVGAIQSKVVRIQILTRPSLSTRISLCDWRRRGTYRTLNCKQHCCHAIRT